MRVLVLGGAGVLGRAAIPHLLRAHIDVAATTRRQERLPLIEALGCRAVTLDAYDRHSVVSAIAAHTPDVLIHLMTDLERGDLATSAALRTTGTRNIVDTAKAHGVTRIVTASIAWVYAPGTHPATEAEPLGDPQDEPSRTTMQGVRALESTVNELPGSVVLRLGQLYGPGTWYAPGARHHNTAMAGQLPATETVRCFIHIQDAGRALAHALSWQRGTWNVVDNDPALGWEWVPHFAEAVGAPPPPLSVCGDIGRPGSNARALDEGITLTYPTWRGSLGSSRDSV